MPEGLYRAKVVNATDPEGRSRIRMTVPALMGNLVLPWALPTFPASSSGAVLPAVGDVVWCGFEGGDVNFPVWVGPLPQVPDPPPSIPPFFMKTVVVDYIKGDWSPPAPITYTRLVASLFTAGSTDTTIFVERNMELYPGSSGHAYVSLTIPAGQQRAAADISIAVNGPEDDIINVGVSTAGGGAVGLTVQIS